MMEQPSQPSDLADDRPRVPRTTGAPASHRRERSSVRVNEEKLAAPGGHTPSSGAPRPHGREALPPVNGAPSSGGGGRRQSATAAMAVGVDGGDMGERPEGATDGGGGGGGASSSRRRGSIHSQLDGDDGLPSAQQAERPSSSSSSFRPTSRGSSRVPRGRADSLASAHQAYDGDFAGDTERSQAAAGGPSLGPRSAGVAGSGGGDLDAGEHVGWRSGQRAAVPPPVAPYEPDISERAFFAAGRPTSAAGGYYSSAPYGGGGGVLEGTPRLASGVEHSSSLAAYAHHHALPREHYQQGVPRQEPELVPSADDPAVASSSLPTMVTIVHFGCRSAQGLLAGIMLATLLFVSNAGGAAETTSAVRVLLALSAAPGLLPALRYATYVLATLSWLGAGWAYLEYRRARREAEMALTVPAATEPGQAAAGWSTWCLASVCGAACFVCCPSQQTGAASASREAGLQQQLQQQLQLQQGPAQLGRAQPFSWGLQQLFGGFTTAGAFLQRHASVRTPSSHGALHGGGGDTAGAAVSAAATLASGARAMWAFAAYCVLMASVWGCMASDSRLHVAAAGIAALAAGGSSTSVAAAVDAYVNDASLRSHAEAWIALAVCRLVCALMGWLLASSIAASPSGVDQWAAAMRGNGGAGAAAAAATAQQQQQQQQQQHKGASIAEMPPGSTSYTMAEAGRSVDFDGGGGGGGGGGSGGEGRLRQLLVSSSGYTTTAKAVSASSGSSSSWAPTAAPSASRPGDGDA